MRFRYLRDKSVSDAWYRKVQENDKGLLPEGRSWYATNTAIKDWKTMKVPGYWDNYGAKDVFGVVWIKKEIKLAKALSATDAELNLGILDDADSTYFNGVWIGSTINKYTYRKYKIPNSLIKEGKNEITVRLVNTDGLGGFIPEKPYTLLYNNQSISLEGDWKFQIGAKVEALPVTSFTRLQNQPASLYNGMIAPFVGYTIKGAAWYQGESNAALFEEYRKLLPSMISDWRKKFGQGDFPFLIVQLANFLPPKSFPVASNWAGLREAQLLTAQNIPNCGLAVTIDIGETFDIHPLNKWDVGKRLALAAEKIAYQEKKIVHSGPSYRSMEIKGNTIILSFDNIGSGLMAKDTVGLRQFAIAGADKKFVWAKASIHGNKIIVESDAIQNPVAVRYAWADNPLGCNLYNKEGLPASPFRTDDWENKENK